jgi:hypothetical protein
MEIVKDKTILVRLNLEELKEAISLFMVKNNHAYKKISNITDTHDSIYEPISNTEGETYERFSGVEALIEV